MKSDSRETQTGLAFRIRHPEGRVEQLLVDAERALIGSAAHCEVRLPPELVAQEHVEVLAADGRVQITARVASAPPAIDGVPCVTGLWKKGSIMTIGGVAFTVDVVDLTQKQKGRSPFWLLAPVPVVATIATLIYSGVTGAAERKAPDSPPLFDAPLTDCPQKDPQLAPAYAAEKMRTALAKRESGPFSPRDAVESVPVFETAAACFRSIGDAEQEHEAQAAAASQRRKMDEEYNVRRVRLEHAFRISDPFAAKRELKILIPMTSHRHGQYVEWLGWLDRYATLEIEKRTSTHLGK